MRKTDVDRDQAAFAYCLLREVPDVVAIRRRGGQDDSDARAVVQYSAESAGPVLRCAGDDDHASVRIVSQAE